MNLKIGCFYKLNFNVGGKILTYTGKIIFIDNNSVSFLDKYNKEITYNLNTIVNFEEIKEVEDA